MQPARKPYPSDASDAEWAFVAPYLCLLAEDAVQRRHELREVFNALRWLVRAGAPWRLLPHDFPPWEIVYQQTMRWLRAGVFEAMVHDLRVLLLRASAGRARAAARGRHPRQPHPAVDAQDRAQVERLAAAIQEATGEAVEVAYVDQGYTGAEPAAAARAHGIRLVVVKHPEARRGSVLLPRRWVVERSFAWAPRFRRLAKDYERLPTTLAGLHCLAFVCPMVHKAVPLLASGA